MTDITTRLREGRGNDIDLFTMMGEAANEIDRWRWIADELATELVKTFDGHRSTEELKAYAAYLRAKG